MILNNAQDTRLHLLHKITCSEKNFCLNCLEDVGEGGKISESVQLGRSELIVHREYEVCLLKYLHLERLPSETVLAASNAIW